MSRIGRIPIVVPSGVDVAIDGSLVTVKGPKGTLSHTVVTPITVTKDDGVLNVTRPDDERESALAARPDPHAWSTTWSSVSPRATRRSSRSWASATASCPRARPSWSSSSATATRSRSTPPTGITFTVEGPTRLGVQGIDKQLVGEVAANIRKLRKPEPYKGKGVRYAGEHIRRKVGKAGK